MAGPHTRSSGEFRKMLIVMLLIAAMIIFNRFGDRTSGLDPTAMLALGFVVLASYTFGQLVERIRLPHITGYLLAGLLLGPSMAEQLPDTWRLPPFDQGILAHAVIQQLQPLDTLAVALIAMTAGGELRIEKLRRGLKEILALLGGQLIAVIALCILFVVAISGGIPAIALPGIGELQMGAAIALGSVVGAISVATSPAATLAVINDVKAAGRYTDTVLATVVFKDVIVVIFFSLASTFAAQSLGFGSEHGSGGLGTYLLQHIGGSLVLGGAIGLAAALYLRYIGREVLLFVVGLTYTAAFVANALDVEVVLLFITAGFVAVNFSSQGERLLHSIETLALPVYVVFFTLAGARLHLDELFHVAPFAVALVLLRGLALWLGGKIGTRFGLRNDEVQRRGWLGFVSQAGVAISLAGILGRSFGEPGEALATLVIAGIALNELVGPILLKVGLIGAGEAGQSTPSVEDNTKTKKDEESDEGELHTWSVPAEAPNAWGPRLQTQSQPLNEAVRDLQLDLNQLAAELDIQKFEDARDESLALLRDLRREFLRHHRRITVMALDERTELNAGEALRLQQTELAEKWRISILGRASRIKNIDGWRVGPLLEAVDTMLEGTREEISVPYDPINFLDQAEDGNAVKFRRQWLRFRRAAQRTLGLRLPPRLMPVRAFARYYLWGLLPERLEPVVALHTQAEHHLAARIRSIFEGLTTAYSACAREVESHQREHADDENEIALDPIALGERLRQVRRNVEAEMRLASEEVHRISEDLSRRVTHALGSCIRDMKADVPYFMAPKIPLRARALTRVYSRREQSLDRLENGRLEMKKTSAAVYARLALEMELIGLEGRIKELVDEHASQIAKNVRGKAYVQTIRTCEALQAAHDEFETLLENEHDIATLTEGLKRIADPLIRLSAEAARVAAVVRDQLVDEKDIMRILDLMIRAAQDLTAQYEIPAGPVRRGEHRLPPPVETVEVPFRDWVLSRIESNLTPELLQATREMASKVEPLAHAFSELERRIAFNLELALGELAIVEDDILQNDTRKLVREMLVNTVERNQELFEGYRVASQAWAQEANDAVRLAVRSGLGDLRGKLVDGELGRLRFQLVRDVEGRRLIQRVGEFRRNVARASKIMVDGVSEALGEERLDIIRLALGLPDAPLDEADLRPSFVEPAAKKSIPMVYRRLFSAQALEAGDILTGRDAALTRAQGVLEDRSDHQLRSVAIVGPDGVGKSTFVNSLIRSRRWAKVHELDIDGPATPKDIDDFLPKDVEGHLFVISGLHWLRSLRAGGLSPLRQFIQGVLNDAGRNAFIVRADALVWAQSKEVAPLQEAFPEVIALDPLDVDALASAVLARHTVSGYGLIFQRGHTPQSRVEDLALSLTAPLTRPQRTFFRALHTASGGLLRDALRLWLASVEEVDQAGDFVHLGPVPAPTIHALRQLSDDAVLTLYQVARQGWMDAQTQSELFRVDPSTAQAQLMSLVNKGVLRRKNDVWRIALHLRGAVYRLLVEKGFVA